MLPLPLPPPAPAASRIRKRAVTQLWCLACGTRSTARWKYVHAGDALLSTFGRLVLCRACARALSLVRASEAEACARTHVRVLEAVLAASLLKQRRCSLAARRGRCALQIDEQGQLLARPVVRARDCSEDVGDGRDRESDAAANEGAGAGRMDAHFDVDAVLELGEPRTTEWARAAALVNADLITPYASVGAHLTKRRRTDADGGVLERLARAAPAAALTPASAPLEHALAEARLAASSSLLDAWLAAARADAVANAVVGQLGALLEGDARYAAIKRYGASAAPMCARAPHALVSTRRVAQGDDGAAISRELALLAATRPFPALVLSPRATWFEQDGAGVTLHEALELPYGARSLASVLDADASRRTRCSTLRAFVQIRALLAPHALEFAAADFESVRHGLYVVAPPPGGGATSAFCVTHCVLRLRDADAGADADADADGAPPLIFARDVYALTAELLFDGDAHALESAAATHADEALRAWLAYAFSRDAPLARPHADFFAHRFFAHLNSPFCVE